MEEKKTLSLEASKEISHIGDRLLEAPKKTIFDRFERFTFLQLSSENKGEIAKEIVTEDGEGDLLYWMEIILSSSIATFGLLQNSVAIIIGAMLIAPLLQPMKTMAFAISTGRSRFFWKASFFLVKSILLSIVVASFLLFIVPVKIETSEILARTTPNILDLFVAIFSAMVAFLSLSYKKLSDSVAGVAMAASLMPPLAVCGIELMLGNYMLAWGGFFLFFVNFIAILIVGVVIFMMYGFTPHEELKQKMSSRKIFTLLAIVLLTVYPLYSSLSSISEGIKKHKIAESFLEQELPSHIEGAELASLKILTANDSEIHFFGSVRIPENVEVYQETYNSLVDGMKEVFQKDINLELEMVRTASFATKDRAPDFVSVFQSTLRKKFSDEFSNFSLVQIETEKTIETSTSDKDQEENIEKENPEIKSKNTEFIITRITVSVPSGEYLEEEDKKAFEESVKNSFLSRNIRFLWVEIAQAPEKKVVVEHSPEEKFQNTLELEWEHFFTTPFFQNIEVKDLNITWNLKKGEELFSHDNIEVITLRGNLFHPNSQRKEAIGNYIRSFVSKLSYEKVVVDFRFIAYEEEFLSIESGKEIPDFDIETSEDEVIATTDPISIDKDQEN